MFWCLVVFKEDDSCACIWGTRALVFRSSHQDDVCCAFHITFPHPFTCAFIHFFLACYLFLGFGFTDVFSRAFLFDGLLRGIQHILSPNGGFFYVETGEGVRVIAGVSVDRGTNHLIYKGLSNL